VSLLSCVLDFQHQVHPTHTQCNTKFCVSINFTFLVSLLPNVSQ